MKIEIGKIFNTFENIEHLALDIPGLGIRKAIMSLDGFDYVELNRKELIKLRDEINVLLINEIDKESEDEKKANI